MAQLSLLPPALLAQWLPLLPSFTVLFNCPAPLECGSLEPGALPTSFCFSGVNTGTGPWRTPSVGLREIIQWSQTLHSFCLCFFFHPALKHPENRCDWFQITFEIIIALKKNTCFLPFSSIPITTSHQDLFPLSLVAMAPLQASIPWCPHFIALCSIWGTRAWPRRKVECLNDTATGLSLKNSLSCVNSDKYPVS